MILDEFECNSANFPNLRCSSSTLATFCDFPITKFPVIESTHWNVSAAQRNKDEATTIERLNLNRKTLKTNVFASFHHVFKFNKRLIELHFLTSIREFVYSIVNSNGWEILFCFEVDLGIQ